MLRRHICLSQISILSFTCNFFAYFKFYSDWGRVIGKIKQNELDCRDTAPLTPTSRYNCLFMYLFICSFSCDEAGSRFRLFTARQFSSFHFNCKYPGLCSYPFNSQYPHTNSLNLPLYITLKNELREFDKRSKHFFLSHHFINSHNLISWQYTDIIGRKLMLVTIGT